MSEHNTLTSRELGFLLRQKQFNWYIIYTNVIQVAKKIEGSTNTRSPLLRFRSALHCGYRENGLEVIKLLKASFH